MAACISSSSLLDFRRVAPWVLNYFKMRFTAILRTPGPAPNAQSGGAALVASVSGADELAAPISNGCGPEAAFSTRWRTGTRTVGIGPTTSSPPDGGTSGASGRLPYASAVGMCGGTSAPKTTEPPSSRSRVGWLPPTPPVGAWPSGTWGST